MSLLSLPLPRIPASVVEHLPIRVPFPFMRIASILPQAINEPIKNSLMALFRLAWSAKLQIPVLITVVFMACDIRLQLEINIFWENNNRIHGSNRNGSQRRASREDMRRAALVAAALYQQQRRRLIQEMRSQQAQERENALPVHAPLAAEEDSDLDGSQGNLSETGTVTCSHRSTSTEALSLESCRDSVGPSGDYRRKVISELRKKRMKPDWECPETDDETEDDEEEEVTSDEDDDDGEDDDNDPDMNGGGSSSQRGGAGGGGYRESDDDDDSDDMDDENLPTGGDSPLILEIELRHRPLHGSSQTQMQKVICNKEFNVFRTLLLPQTTRSIVAQKILIL